MSLDIQTSRPYNMHVVVLVVTFLHAVMADDATKENCYCPSDESLKEIIDGFVLNIDPKNLVGTWMDVVIPQDDFANFVASYAKYETDADGVSIKVTNYDYLLGNKMSVYFESLKKKEGGKKGVYAWVGTDEKIKSYSKDTFFFYADEYVLAFYNCDPKLEIEKGWDIGILVHARNRKDLLAKEDNPTKQSLAAARKKLDEITTKNEEWKKSHDGKFGLIGPAAQVDLNNLMPNNWAGKKP